MRVDKRYDVQNVRINSTYIFIYKLVLPLKTIICELLVLPEICS